MSIRQNKGCFCKVCKDAGKPESEYTSHFVKDKPGADGIVICPTLLSQHCRYCNGAGHTPSHCPSLARDKKRQAKDEHERDRAQRRRDYDASTNMRSLTKEELSHVKFGGFSALRVPKKEKKEDDEFPALVSKPKPAATFGKKSFASVAIAGELDASKKEIERLKTELASSKARQRLNLPTPTPTPVIVPYRCNDAWDDEEDEEWMRSVAADL